MTTKGAFPSPADRRASEWLSIPVSLDTGAIDQDMIDALSTDIFEYACLETFGVMPDEFEEDFGENATDCLELAFLRKVVIENVEICLWTCRDTREVWSDAIVAHATWDRPPLKTKGNLLSIGESEGLTPDQYAWRHFHLDLIPMLTRNVPGSAGTGSENQE